MEDITVGIITGSVCLTAGYIAYVVTTHGDGTVLFAFGTVLSGLIMSLITHHTTKRKYKKVNP